MEKVNMTEINGRWYVCGGDGNGQMTPDEAKAECSRLNGKGRAEPRTNQSGVCHYCGQSTKKTGFFGEYVCAECAC